MNRLDAEFFTDQFEKDQRDREGEACREAHAEEVEEMRLARECGEYDCGQDDSNENDENCSDCHYSACPKKLEAIVRNKETKRRRERRKRARAKRALLRPNYKAYLNYSNTRQTALINKGYCKAERNAIIFEEWHSMAIDAKIPFYDKFV
jgi:hypothetical protein